MHQIQLGRYPVLNPMGGQSTIVGKATNQV